MDEIYPTLKRPKKKLVFPTNKASAPDQWTKDINTLEDVDKMFEDLDSKVEDFPSPSLEIHIPNKNKHVERDVTPLPLPDELLKCQRMANGDHERLHQAPASPELDMVTDTPLKSLQPVKTSSPIEGNEIQYENKERNKRDNSASPILFDCEDENQDLETAKTPTEKPQNNNKRDESDDSVFETLPKTLTLNKKLTQKKKTDQKRSKPSSPLGSPVRSELRDASAPEKPTENVQLPTKVKRDMASFLQKLKDTKQAKPTLVGISPVKVMPQLPQPEDDFLILEDDVPFYVSIPSKNVKSTKEKRKKTSTDTEAKDTTGEERSADKERDNEQDQGQQETETLAEKNKKTMTNNGSESNPVKDHTSLATTESDNVENLSQKHQKKRKVPSQKKVKKVPSKVKPIDTATESDDGIPAKKMVKEKKTGKKGSKPLKNEKGNARRKMNPAKENRKVDGKALTDEVEEQNQELNVEDQPDNGASVSELSNVETEPAGNQAGVKLGPNMPSSQEQTSDESVLGKRKRKPPGDWWMNDSPESAVHQAIIEQPTVKKTKRTNKKSSSASSSVKAATGGKKKNPKPSLSSDKQRSEKKMAKKGKVTRKRPVKMVSEKSDEVLGHVIQDQALSQDSDSSPLMFTHRERSLSSGERAFHNVYQKGASEKKSSSPEAVLGSKRTTKRTRKCPGDFWLSSPTAEEQEVVSSPPQPQLQNPKKSKNAGKKKKSADKPAAQSPSEAQEGALKQRKRSLATVDDLFSAVVGSPTKTSPAEDHNVINELQGSQDQSQNSIHTAKVIESGPSSMIANIEEDDDTAVLPSSTVQPALSASDLCSSPLRPLILQPKDDVNLRDWLRSLWPPSDKNPEITPDHFEWYCHRGKAMGLLVDLQTGSICTGKLLLGSSMKKPLWVDHSATTVFNLLTGSVSAVVDCNKTRYCPGQSFIVPPGHAYSLRNLNAQPAVLYFTRIFSDEAED